MQIVTDYVLPDEPCHGLAEGPLTMPDPSGKGTRKRWVQRVFVVRDDEIAKYTVDIGPVDGYPGVPELRMSSLGDDTVAQLQEHAEHHRTQTRYADLLHEYAEDSTLIEDSLAGLEQEHLTKKNRTIIGPHVFSQRGDYPSQFARRELMSKEKRTNGRN